MGQRVEVVGHSQVEDRRRAVGDMEGVTGCGVAVEGPEGRVPAAEQGVTGHVNDG